jgi:hypothetical protein
MNFVQFLKKEENAEFGWAKRKYLLKYFLQP